MYMGWAMCTPIRPHPSPATLTLCLLSPVPLFTLSFALPSFALPRSPSPALVYIQCPRSPSRSPSLRSPSPALIVLRARLPSLPPALVAPGCTCLSPALVVYECVRACTAHSLLSLPPALVMPIRAQPHPFVPDFTLWCPPTLICARPYSLVCLSARSCPQRSFAPVGMVPPSFVRASTCGRSPRICRGCRGRPCPRYLLLALSALPVADIHIIVSI